MTQVLRGASVIDGTGAPRRRADVVVSDGRIVSIGDGDYPAGAEIVDLDGLALAPGFIDIHTHLDFQVLWDPDLTPSSWHGVTTVVMGNCGFSVAPTRPEHRDTIMRTLENVEAMPLKALQAGVDWDFETFPEYLDAVARRPKRLNVGAFVGHSAVRLFVMGDDATERAATEEEVAVMRSVVHEAMVAGAMGFATSRALGHIGAFGKPVPSRLADPEEINEIAMALKDVGRGLIEIVSGPGFGHRECAEISARTGRPLTFFLLTGRAGPGAATQVLDQLEEWGGQVVPQTACRAITVQVNLTDLIPLFQVSDAFREAVPLPREQLAELYASAAWRQRVRETLKPGVMQRLGNATLEETVRHTGRIGMTLDALAQEDGTDPLTAFLDLSLADDLQARFRWVITNDDEPELGRLLGDKRCIVGLSDAGAHVSQLCDADYGSHLLSHWVRERPVLSLEDAVWRLTGQPAELFGIPQRGRIAPGYHADLVAFDPDRVATSKPRRVHDFPAGADRLVADSTGIEHVWVNGVAVRRHGKDIDGAHPGVLVTPSA